MDTDEYLTGWEDLIETVDKTEIPIRFVNRICFDSDQFSTEAIDSMPGNQLDIATLRDQGYPDDVIQEIINEIIKEIAQFSGTMDFFLNIPEVARVAQEVTDQYLK